MSSQWDAVPDDALLMVELMRAIQQDHTQYGLVRGHEGYLVAEHEADLIIREHVNPNWKSAPRFDAWWARFED